MKFAVDRWEKRAGESLRASVTQLARKCHPMGVKAEILYSANGRIYRNLKHQEHDLEVAEQHWLASIVVAARANGKPLALGSSRFLVLADVPYVENDTAGTLAGTLMEH